MKKLLPLAAAVELSTGVALLVVPLLVGRLLVGAELVGVSVPVARVAGIALIALGVGCWPGPGMVGMLIYSLLTTLYLLYLGIRGEWVGPLLWPAVVVRAVLTVLLAREWFRPQPSFAPVIEQCTRALLAATSAISGVLFRLGQLG